MGPQDSSNRWYGSRQLQELVSRRQVQFFVEARGWNSSEKEVETFPKKD
jgi:hypothetical protein